MTFLPKKCETCDGSGWIRRDCNFDAGETVPDLCYDCDGNGEFYLQKREYFAEGDIDGQGAIK